MKQKLSPTARCAKAIRDKKAAMTPDRRAKKAENQVKRREAIKAGKDIKVSYAEGCRISIGGSWVEDKVTIPDPEEEKEKIAEAVKVAEKSDVVVLVLGGNEQTSREAWSNNHMGDRADLKLFGMQDDLIDAIYETGKPIVAFLFKNKAASGFPTWLLWLIIAISFPFSSIFSWSSIVKTDKGVIGIMYSSPFRVLPIFCGFNPSTSFFGFNELINFS